MLGSDVYLCSAINKIKKLCARVSKAKRTTASLHSFPLNMLKYTWPPDSLDQPLPFTLKDLYDVDRNLTQRNRPPPK